MCNQYSPSDPHIVALHFKVKPPAEAYKRGIGPWGRGPFVRNTEAGREAVVGQWALIGDKATGEIVDSYTMLTINADADPLMSRMHKPDPKLPDHQQDKRSVVVIEPADFDGWLTGSIDEAKSLIRLAPTGVYEAGPDRSPS